MMYFSSGTLKCDGVASHINESDYFGGIGKCRLDCSDVRGMHASYLKCKQDGNVELELRAAMSTAIFILVRLENKHSFAYVDQAYIRFWDQPVLSNSG